ncbi:MAG: PaaI family thioesterase [Thermoplasmata archaeon]|uniref:PaaI family thioesterase n=1 Tax=Candidatus Sysuiplasma superficiale TaxID=2823368 RepID=A0A8J8CDW7_9ARCH|nr:PaaI family thioesterase [Candidatus Sysuiplasma superficiale]
MPEKTDDVSSLARLSSIIRGDPFLGHLGVEVLEVRKGYAKLRMPDSEVVLRYGGIVNGGAVCTLIDAAGGTATATVNQGKNQVTVELKVNFLETVPRGDMVCEAKVVRGGRNIVVAEMDLFDRNQRLCAKGIGTWMILYDAKFKV